jgi:hypothetical protein
VAAAVWYLAESALHKSYEIARTTGAYWREVVARVYLGLQLLKLWEAYTSNGAIADYACTMQACLSFFARIQTVLADVAAVLGYKVDDYV